MKSLNKYILEKLIINKNFKNADNELNNIIDLITDGKMSEMKRNGMEWGYRLEHNSLTPKDLLESIEKNIKQIYSSISVDVNEHLDKGLGVIVVSSLDNSITFYKSLLDENRIIALSIYELSSQFRGNRKIKNASTTVSASCYQGVHSSEQDWEIKDCYKIPIDDFISLFETIVNNDHVIGTGHPTKSDYDKIINHMKRNH